MMTRAIIAAGLLACCMASDATADRPDALLDWAQSRIEDGQAAAIAIARLQGDTVEFTGLGQRSPGGPAPDADTRFQIGSITKVFTHLLLAELDAKDVVDARQPVGELLPEAIVLSNPAVGRISLWQLATHRSGLPRLPAMPGSDPADPYAGFDGAQLWRALAQARAGQPLGSHYGYSNFGVGLLGVVLGRADGDGYRAALQQHVIASLDLAETGFEPGPRAATPVSAGTAVAGWRFGEGIAAAGALWSSAADLARLLRVWTGDRAHTLVHDPQSDLVAVPGAPVTPVWHLADGGTNGAVYWHNGGTGGFRSFAGFRSDGTGLVVLVSGDADPTAVGLATLGAVTAEPTPARIDTSLVGEYRFDPTFAVAIVADNGRLLARATGQPRLPLQPLGDDLYALVDVDASLQFVREDGAAVAVELIQNNRRQRAVRIADSAERAVRQTHQLDRQQMAAYLGRYRISPGAELTIRLRDGGLQAQLTGQSFLPIHAAGDDRFFYRVVDAELQFERDPTGAVVALVLHQAGLAQRAERID